MAKSLSSSALSLANAPRPQHTDPVIPSSNSTASKTLVHSSSMSHAMTNSSDYSSQTSSVSTPASRLSSASARQHRNSTSQQTVNSPTIQPPAINNKLVQLFGKVWSLLNEMQHDPHPEVADLVQKVVGHFSVQATHFDHFRRNIVLQSGASPIAELIEPIPLKIATEFVAWSSKHFLKPLLPNIPNAQIDKLLMNKPVDFYTTEFLDLHCKLLFNNKMKQREPPEWIEPQYMEETLQIKHNTFPIHCKIHPYDDLLFVADKESVVSVYDIQSKTPSQGQLRLSFPNLGKSSRRSVITSLKLINAQHEPLVMTGSNDRVVRLFKPDLTNFKGSHLVTAFAAFSDSEKKSSSREAGLIIEWDEPNEVLLCAGDVGQIRAWDMQKELFRDYQTQVGSCVSSLSASDNLVVAGFGDGTIKLYDLRRATPLASIGGESSASPILRRQSVYSTPMPSHYNYHNHTLHQHQVFVLKVKIHKPSYKVITSSTLGDVNIFDLRNLSNVLKSSIPNQNEAATAIECHPINELIAM